jgi:GNAT superfamily N-acetyltransferase
LTGGTKEGYEPLGLATYHIENGECELITLNSFLENQGVGEALFFRVRELAVAAGCTRYFLTTSNDNLRAMQFYQKRGMRMVKIHIGAIDAARERVPGIPLVGANGIPCRDEVEMEEELFIK